MKLRSLLKRHKKSDDVAVDATSGNETQQSIDIQDPTDLNGVSFGRALKPKDDDIFYHYCSMETFKAIVQTKTIRFSDINMMNDYGETSWTYDVFLDAANRLLQEKEGKPILKDLNSSFLDEIDKIYGGSQLFIHPVIACFSRKPDVLSQWRAYAGNGAGVSIGFSGRILKNLPTTIMEIEYDREKQVQELKMAIGTIYMQYIDAGKKFSPECVESTQLLSAYRHAYKNPGFSEEEEVRCLHLLDVKRPGNFMHLEDAGGTAGGAEVAGEKVKFRISDGGVIAYIDIPYDRSNNQPLISEITLGPSNNNSPGNILYFLGSEGFHTPTVKKSETTFRV